MNMKETNKYRYTDTAERNIRMNRFYIIASSFLAIVFLFYLWLKLVNHNIAPIVTYANTIPDRCFLCDKCRNAPSK